MAVVWAYPVETEVERVLVEDVEIQEVRVAREAPTEAIVGWEVQAAAGVESATLERSNTVPPSYCSQGVGALSNEVGISLQLRERVRESSR